MICRVFKRSSQVFLGKLKTFWLFSAGQSHIIRLQPFGNLSAVPQIVYNDAFPVARLRFLGNCLFSNKIERRLCMYRC